MMYSFRIEQAIRAASVLHTDMTTTGRVSFPYTAHLFSVACIIADYTKDEDAIIAGLLHDTLAYTDYTQDELTEDFGPTVSAIVAELTPPKDDTTAASRHNWKNRHARYTTQLKNASDPALIVVAADTIHRLRSIIESYYDDSARLQDTTDNTAEEHLATCQSIANILNRRSKNDIVHEFNHVFDEYKKFLYEAQHKNTTETA